MRQNCRASMERSSSLVTPSATMSASVKKSCQVTSPSRCSTSHWGKRWVKNCGRRMLPVRDSNIVLLFIYCNISYITEEVKCPKKSLQSVRGIFGIDPEVQAICPLVMHDQLNGHETGLATVERPQLGVGGEICDDGPEVGHRQLA
jgi:hypothetical protein